MTEYRIKISEEDFKQLRDAAFAHAPNEAAVFALAGKSDHRSVFDILVRRTLPVPTEDFDVQEKYRLQVSASAINSVISLCEANKLGLLICHSHPGDIPYSLTDTFGEKRIAEAVRQFIPEDTPIASLLFTPDRVYARIWLPSGPRPIDEVLIIGKSIRRIALSSAVHAPERFDAATFDRHIPILGEEGQGRIAGAKVAIIGAGATGSSVAEQLCRLGVNNFVLIDDDAIESSTIARMYGSFERHVKDKRQKHLKVVALADHLRSIRSSIKVEEVVSKIHDGMIVEKLADRDVIFLCTDDHWGRSIVNQIAYQYLIPTINVGVGLRVHEGKFWGGRGRVDILRPGNPCLWCKQFLDPGRITAESMSKKERQKNRYIEGLDVPAPAVIPFTTTVASLGCALFLELIVDTLGDGANVETLNYFLPDMEVSSGITATAEKCICKKVKGFGDLMKIF